MKLRLQPCTILVVEDFELYRRFIRSALEPREGLQIVAEASDGLEAIQKAKELKSDLVLIDISLPKLNGVEAVQHIRRVAPRSTLLFVSQLSSADVIREAFRLGASGYVISPVPSASRVSTIGSAEVSCAVESSHGTQAGSEVVQDAALVGELRAANPGFACRTARHILWSWLRPAY